MGPSKAQETIPSSTNIINILAIFCEFLHTVIKGKSEMTFINFPLT
jgi:hypothetical protein